MQRYCELTWVPEYFKINFVGAAWFCTGRLAPVEGQSIFQESGMPIPKVTGALVRSPDTVCAAHTPVPVWTVSGTEFWAKSGVANRSRVRDAIQRFITGTPLPAGHR